MSFLTTATLNLKFEISHVEDKSMGLTFINNNQIDIFERFDTKHLQYQTIIQFPSSLIIKTSGKQHGDTIMDSDGNIISDKYIKLLGIELDGLSCNEYYINDCIMLTANDGTIVQSNYWGFNGETILNFLEKNSFYWLLHSFNQTRCNAL